MRGNITPYTVNAAVNILLTPNNKISSDISNLATLRKSSLCSLKQALLLLSIKGLKYSHLQKYSIYKTAHNFFL